MSWLTKIIPRLNSESKKREMPDGLWKKCPECNDILYLPDLLRHMMVCTNCSYHMQISARHRAKTFFDKDSIVEHFGNFQHGSEFQNTVPNCTLKDLKLVINTCIIFTKKNNENFMRNK